MKILQSKSISSFGGLNFIFEELNKHRIHQLLNNYLPKLHAQSKYSWHDILYSYWSILFCGGDCAEDISHNLKHAFAKNPFVNAPSSDRLLGRLKQLAVSSQHFKKNRSDVFNEFSLNSNLNRLNLKVINQLSLLGDQGLVLDYDNTFLYHQKADAKRTYKKETGYCPGVGIIGNKVVYIENRNGNCAPHTLQDETIERMFNLLDSENIKVDTFRADSASYQFSTIATISKYVNKLYIKAKMNENICTAINNITNWTKLEIDGKTMFRGSTLFTPFKNSAKRTGKPELLKQYRLVVTKESRDDGQINFFTNEACNYSPILTNDFDRTNDQVVFFYNQRGKQEREFDILKNDFAWNKLPFSKLEQNTVFLIVTAICRNIYDFIIRRFSRSYKFLSESFRIKKFIFRFVCIPAKWIKSGRSHKLRIYGYVAFKT